VILWAAAVSGQFWEDDAPSVGLILVVAENEDLARVQSTIRATTQFATYVEKCLLLPITGVDARAYPPPADPDWEDMIDGTADL